MFNSLVIPNPAIGFSRAAAGRSFSPFYDTHVVVCSWPYVDVFVMNSRMQTNILHIIFINCLATTVCYYELY